MCSYGCRMMFYPGCHEGILGGNISRQLGRLVGGVYRRLRISLVRVRMVPSRIRLLLRISPRFNVRGIIGQVGKVSSEVLQRRFS